MRRWALCCVLLLAGCAEVTTGQPTEIVRGPDSTVPPPYTQPALSFEKYLAKPCDLLSREQLSTIGIVIDQGKIETSPLGPDCVWQADKSMDTGIVVSLLDKGAGLGPAYRNRGWGYFAETTIGGYPAINTDNVKPVGRATPVGMCFTTVGIAPLLAFKVQAVTHKPNPDYEQPCKVSDRVATWVLEKLRASG
ncbi:DUF3558 domain-containing protein [Allokutzneria sp. NRRL B-24872]|uniref:DUF3558 domain-containing protein n=1 Tax=Allokutzneria sp. NRRL B-24872 TaxID=1137961 RepID=UPI000A3C728D|nr:DUF3558 domain-containing protein [Allokutzneria sp. NRRL B-24872]